MSNVYFIDVDGFTKIGIATDVNRRLSQLQVHTPHKATLITSVKPINGKVGVLEACLHQYYGPYHVRGEWFNLPRTEVSPFVLCDTIDVSKLRDIVIDIPATDNVDRSIPLVKKLSM